MTRKNGWQLAEHAGERPPTASSGCWPPPTGTPTRSATTCAPTWSSTWAIRRGAGGRRDRVPQEGGQLGGGPAPVHGTAGRSRTASSASSWPTPAPGAGVPRPGAVPARGLDRRPGPVPRRARPRGGAVRDQAGAGPADARARPGRRRAGGVGHRRRGLRRQSALRLWLEERQVPYVLAVKCTDTWRPVAPRAWCAPTPRSWPLRCRPAVGGLQRRARRQGTRLYGWARIPLPPRPLPVGTLAAGASQPPRRELAFYACFGPAETSLPAWSVWPGPAGRWRRASRPPRPRSAWTTTRCAAGRAGTAISPWPCWRMRFWSSPAPRPPPTSPQGGRGRLTSQLGLLPLTVPEVCRLLVALVWTTPIHPGFVLAWSPWRRRHQARARRAHYQRRERQGRWSIHSR